MDKGCGTCRFLQELSKGVRGECRRHAPRPGDRGDAVWPGVSLGDGDRRSWCGEWEPNAEEQKRIMDKAKVQFAAHNAEALAKMNAGYLGRAEDVAKPESNARVTRRNARMASDDLA